MPTDYLKKDEFVPIGLDLELGEQIHINHEDCPAGQDTKRRLYIKRGDDDGNDIIMAYCHNCTKRGTHSESYSRVLGAKKESKQRINGSSNLLPRDHTGVWDEWDVRGTTWVRNGGIDESRSQRWGLGYSPSSNRVVIPINDQTDGSLMGYQLRSLSAVDSPKYLTVKNKTPFYWYSGKVNSTLVIVEDVLSGIRCEKYCSSIALLSSGMSDEVYAFIAGSGHTNFIVYLDNDNRQVKVSQLSMVNRLKLLGNVRIIKSDKDPKELNEKELEEKLNV